MLLGRVQEVAAIEQIPMQMTVFTARIAQDPRPAAELVGALGSVRWLDSDGRALPRGEGDRAMAEGIWAWDE